MTTTSMSRRAIARWFCQLSQSCYDTAVGSIHLQLQQGCSSGWRHYISWSSKPPTLGSRVKYRRPISCSGAEQATADISSYSYTEQPLGSHSLPRLADSGELGHGIQRLNSTHVISREGVHETSYRIISDKSPLFESG
jgi:hypothetical protein